MNLTIESTQDISPSIRRIFARTNNARVSVDVYSDWVDAAEGNELSLQFSGTQPLKTDSMSTVYMHGTVASKQDDSALVSNGALLLNITGVQIPELIYGENIFTTLSWSEKTHTTRRKRSLGSGGDRAS